MTKEKANQVLRDYEEFRQLVNITNKMLIQYKYFSNITALWELQFVGVDYDSNPAGDILHLNIKDDSVYFAYPFEWLFLEPQTLELVVKGHHAKQKES